MNRNVLTLLDRAARAAVQLPEWAAIAPAPRPPLTSPELSYGHRHVPGPREPAHGGMVKMQRLAAIWPNQYRRYNILYLGSSCLPRDWAVQLALARRRRALVVLNQNGVATPAWCSGDLESVNAPLRCVLLAADHVIYQSDFCKRASDAYLGPARGEWEVLHNPVDTRHFTPRPVPHPAGPLTLLAAGTINEFYRLQAAARTLAHLRRRRPDARLLIAGRYGWAEPRVAEAQADALLRETGTAAHVTRLKQYTQAEAPGIFRQAQILLHTQFNDNCPTVVLEAMACGLPVVHTGSGGTPELVGDGGLGLHAVGSFETRAESDPGEMGEAVIQVAEELPRFSRAARRRAEEIFDVRPWIERHRRLFAELLAGAAR